MAFLAEDSLSLQDYFVGLSDGNSGFGFDVGLNLRFNDQFEVFATAIDIGSLTMKNRVQEFMVSPSSLNLDITDPVLFEEELNQTFDEAFLSEELADTTFNVGLTSQAFIGGTYRFKKYYTIGLVANPKFRSGSIDFGGSLALTAILNNFIEVAANANFDQDNFNVGAGFVFNGGPFQLYAASDNILSAFQLDKADYFAASLGVNFVFGRAPLKKRKKKKKFKKPVEETLTREEMMMQELLDKENEAEAVDEPEEVVASSDSEPKNEERPEVSGEKEEEEPEEENYTGEVTLNGIAIDSKTNEKLTGISVEFYRLKSDGSREVLLFHGFYNGNINLHMQNTSDHILVIKKQGYGIKEFKITTAEVQGRSSVNKQFPMSKQG